MTLIVNDVETRTLYYPPDTNFSIYCSQACDTAHKDCIDLLPVLEEQNVPFGCAAFPSSFQENCPAFAITTKSGKPITMSNIPILCQEITQQTYHQCEK